MTLRLLCLDGIKIGSIFKLMDFFNRTSPVPTSSSAPGEMETKQVTKKKKKRFKCSSWEAAGKLLADLLAKPQDTTNSAFAKAKGCSTSYLDNLRAWQKILDQAPQAVLVRNIGDLPSTVKFNNNAVQEYVNTFAQASPGTQ